MDSEGFVPVVSWAVRPGMEERTRALMRELSARNLPFRIVDTIDSASWAPRGATLYAGTGFEEQIIAVCCEQDFFEPAASPRTWPAEAWGAGGGFRLSCTIIVLLVGIVGLWCLFAAPLLMREALECLRIRPVVGVAVSCVVLVFIVAVNYYLWKVLVGGLLKLLWRRKARKEREGARP